jgi:hypothetical protein
MQTVLMLRPGAGPGVLLLLLLALLPANPAHASHWLECRFSVEVLAVTETHVQLEPVDFLGGDGSIQPGPDECRRAVGSWQLAREEITDGGELAEAGAMLVAVWSTYGAMGPEGPVSATGWRLFRE